MKQLNFNRYFSTEDLLESIERLAISDKIEPIGKAVSGSPIYAYNWGQGKQRVLLWSQMHGNETTTTKALIEVLDHLINTAEGSELAKQLHLRIIFQLNPDGADAYTRVNRNSIDLNRDAIDQSQPETRVILKEFVNYQPDFCFNLHGQRTIFAAGNSSKPASLSFLAPAADSDRAVTPTRAIAMKLIAEIVDYFPTNDQWGIGRYDDGFNINCLGDYFTSKGTPTLLFEAGHYPDDYLRIKTRELIVQSLLVAFRSIAKERYTLFSTQQYFAIPNNVNHLRDIEVRDVTIVNNGKVTNSTLFVQYKEVLDRKKVVFIPEYVGNTKEYIGLMVIDVKEKNKNNPIDITESAENITKQLEKLINI